MEIREVIKAGFADLAEKRMPTVATPESQAAAEKVLSQLLRATLTGLVALQAEGLGRVLQLLRAAWRYDGFGKVPGGTRRYVLSLAAIVGEHLYGAAPQSFYGSWERPHPLTRSPEVNDFWVAYRPGRTHLWRGETELILLKQDPYQREQRTPATRFIWEAEYKPVTYKHVVRAFILILAILDEERRGVDSSVHEWTPEQLELIRGAYDLAFGDLFSGDEPESASVTSGRSVS